MKHVILGVLLIFLISCSEKGSDAQISAEAIKLPITNSSLIILGNVQDAGSPQIGCIKECCKTLFKYPDDSRKVIALGLIDAKNHKTYMFEATPDISSQMKLLTALEPESDKEIVDGLFLTHAHVGHYTGLMYLGKEAMDARKVPTYVMPRFKGYLTTNGPWDQLVSRNNVSLMQMEHEKTIGLSEDLKVTPFLVPHRDEYSETVGYRIDGPNKSALFIPDIDKWHKWDKDIAEEIKNVDYAFLDATFYSGHELNNRDMSEIPHPFVMESLEHFNHLSATDKEKIIFIHFNHSNPLLNKESKESLSVIDKGFKIGRINDVFSL